jgi:predicted nucleotidyltransferase
VRRVMSTRSTRTGARAATSAEAALRFAQTLARSCAGALGKAVAGVILHGSLTLDDYVPGRSDVDVLVVVDHPLSDARLAALTEAMASPRAEAPGPVDLRLVTRQVAASPTPAPPLEAYLRLPPPGRAGQGRQVGGPAAGFQAPTATLQRRAEQRGGLLELGDAALQLLDLAARQRLPGAAAVEESSGLLQGEARSLTQGDCAHSLNHLRVIAALASAATGRRDQADAVVVAKRGGRQPGAGGEFADGQWSAHTRSPLT